MRTLKAVLLLTLCSTGQLFSCSNVAIAKNEYVVIARTLDFPQNTGGLFAAGFANKANTTDLNLSQSLQDKAISWKAQYNYLGQSWKKGQHVIDGMNEAGLYAGYLYLPDFTRYPQYNSNDSRPLLGVMDVINFVLGSAGSVAEALEKLKAVQIVENAMPTSEKKEFILAPLHVVIRDKSGKSAVLEWINGETVIHANADNVLTNAPPYGWQLKNAEQYDYVQEKNSNAKFDGAFMNGSGFLGIPGDWTPPGRFARATQVVKNMPAPKNLATALQFALSALETVQVPIGTNESPTLWRTLSDLSTFTYYYQPFYDIDAQNNYSSLQDFASSWKKIELKKIFTDQELPVGFVEALCSPTLQGEAKILLNWMIPTPGPKPK